MVFKKLFKKKKTLSESSELTLSTVKDSKEFEDNGSFSENDFKRNDNADSKADKETDEVNSLNLNTNIEVENKKPQIQELEENELLEIYKKDENLLDDEEYSKDIIDDEIDGLLKKDNFKTKNEPLIPFKYKAITLGIVLVIGVLGTSVMSQLEEEAKQIDRETETYVLRINYHLKDIELGLNDHQSTKIFNSWKEIERLSEKVKNNIPKINNNTLTSQFEKMNERLLKVENSINIVSELEKNKILIVKNKESSVNNINEIITDVNKISELYQNSKANNQELENFKALIIKLGEMKFFMENIENENNFGLLNQKREEIKNILIEIAEGNKVKDIKPIFPEAISSYNQMATKWNALMPMFDLANKETEILDKFKNIKENSNILFAEINTIINEIDKIFDSEYINPTIKTYYLIYYFSLLIIATSLILIIFFYRKETKIKEENLIEETNKNKAAILKLLNEMSYLQNGDLTQKTTINDGVTANIAESINSTIDSLAIVVKKIQNSSLLIKEKTKQINQVAEGLLFSTEHQGNSISEVNNSITAMTTAIETISEKTKNILEMAEKSTEASNFGMQNVKNSMNSMLLIDRNIEETSSLMKKVSDSSKQIYEVINLLTDITEETNILALNATVQASKAGEAGNGFKIVANAIHELADKAGDATRKVAALISAVQTDIQSVASAVETTAQDVNNGVELSSSVEKSLNDIANLSNLLENTIKLVAEDVKNNAQIAKQISQNMKSILNITEETKSSARNTSKAISEVDNISSELTASVQSFIVDK